MDSEKFGHNLLAKALSHVGEKEEPFGSNTGPQVDQYLANVGLPPGLAWCAAFACTMVKETLEEMNEGSLLHPMTGSSGAIVEWGKAHNAIVSVMGCEEGDLGIVKGVSSTGYVHTVILWHPLAPNLWKTIEGNEGDQVKVHQRLLTTLTIVRPYADPTRHAQPT